jgi:hypothetical protein
MWVLTAHLNDTHNVTKWLTQEGAIANRERLLKVRREKDKESPTGFRTIWPDGWTAINRESSHRREA